MLTSILSFIVLTLAAIFILGLDSYCDYIQIVLHHQAQFWSCGYNLSLMGFWSKLFNPIATTDPIEPLWRSASIASWGTLISDLMVTAIVLTLIHRARTVYERDLAFGGLVTAMLLVAPVTWDISLPMLLVPLALIVYDPLTAHSRYMVLGLSSVLVIDWVPQNTLTQLVHGNRPFTVIPWTFVVGVPSIKFYALLGTLLLGTVAFLNHMRERVLLR